MKKSAIASSIFIVPRNVLGGPGFISPSDQLNRQQLVQGARDSVI
ncbi:hypothetical protein [Maribacter litopenaei]